MSMTSELIQNLRDKAIGCEAFGVVNIGKLLGQAADVIEELSKQVEKQNMKHGKWVETVFHNGCTFDHDMVCSVCGHSGLPEYEYCPNCGAKMMDEGEGEE